MLSHQSSMVHPQKAVPRRCISIHMTRTRMVYPPGERRKYAATSSRGSKRRDKAARPCFRMGRACVEGRNITESAAFSGLVRRGLRSYFSRLNDQRCWPGVEWTSCVMVTSLLRSWQSIARSEPCFDSPLLSVQCHLNGCTAWSFQVRHVPRTLLFDADPYGRGPYASGASVEAYES